MTRHRDARPLPRSTGRRRPTRSAIRVDSVLDEFSQACLEPELTLRPIRRRSRPASDTALFLAETAWLGNGGRWRYRFSHFEPGNELDRAVQRYRAAGIPTVLWNKEDPAHFDGFVRVAERFDHVLTTDADCVERYRSALGHDRITTMPFAAQPALHHPAPHGPADGGPRTICFAGAWRGDVHPQRIAQLTMLLDAATDVGGLRIHARRPAKGRADFPDRYRDAVVGELPYDRMVEAYRQHACFLNVNTVTDSPTMLSRRVFEILACRTPVVSAPSLAIERIFGDVVPMPTTAAATVEVLAALVGDTDRRDRLGQLGYRAVMTSHTYQHRIADLCRTVGVGGFPSPDLPVADAVVEVPHPADVERAVAVAAPLRTGLGTLVVACHDPAAPDRIEVDGREGTVVVRFGPGVTHGELLGRLPGSGAFVAFLDAEARYGPHMVTDTLLATRFADADAYGKATSHATDGTAVHRVGTGTEFGPTDTVIAGTAVVRRSVLAATATAPGVRPGTDLADAAVGRATDRYAVDRFNHIGPLRVGGTTGPTVAADVPIV